jgi:hypothetical protein
MYRLIRAGFAMKVMGLTPSGDTRWTDIQIALHEPAEARRAHFAKPGAPQDATCRAA